MAGEASRQKQAFLTIQAVTPLDHRRLHIEFGSGSILELNMENQRRELLNAFPLKAYELWQKGERLPQPLEEMLTELKEVDERLNLIRAQRFAKVEEKKQNPETASEESPAEKPASEETEDAGEEPADVPEETPVSEPEVGEETDVPPEEGETGDNA